MKNGTWILVADSAKAKIYNTHKAKLFLPGANESDLKIVKKFTHSEGRKRDQDLVSDNSGRYSSAYHGADTFDPATDPKKYEDNLFAMELVKSLDKGFNNNEFEKLIIIASPVFNGLINMHISKISTLKNAVDLTIEKDYADLNERELVSRIQTYL